MNERNRQLFAHLAFALTRYTKEIRREGITAPPELFALAVFFADCGQARQGATTFDAPTGLGQAGAMENPMLTKREAAADLRCSVRTVERLIASWRVAIRQKSRHAPAL